MTKRRIYLTEERLKNFVSEAIREMRKEQRDFADLWQNLYLYEECLREEYMMRNTRYWISGKELAESRGDNPQIKQIASIMCDKIIALLREKEEEFSRNGLTKIQTTINLDENFFMCAPIISFVLANSDTVGKHTCRFVPNLSNMIVEGRLNQPKFDCLWFSNSVNINRNVLEQTLSHEVMHAYRDYSISIQNAQMPYGEELRKRRYANFIPAMDNRGSTEALVAKIGYTMDQDEINAQSAALSTYLKQHTEINFKNYHRYVNMQTPLYREYIFLTDVLWQLNLTRKQPANVERWGQAINKIMYWNKMSSPTKAFNTFVRKVNDACAYILRQFYKIMEVTMRNENRAYPFQEFTLDGNPASCLCDTLMD